MPDQWRLTVSPDFVRVVGVTEREGLDWMKWMLKIDNERRNNWSVR